MNSSEDALEFALPDGFDWRLIFDSAEPEREADVLCEKSCKVESHACVMIAVTIEAPP